MELFIKYVLPKQPKLKVGKANDTGSADKLQVRVSGDAGSDAGSHGAVAQRGPGSRQAGSEDSLVDLIQRIANQDAKALSQFYNATVASVYGLALRITGDLSAAEDIAGHTYYQVWTHARRFEPQRGSARGWLLSITRNHALNEIVRNRDQAGPHPDPESLLSEKSADRDDPQDLLLATERKAQLHQALTTLEPLSRQLLALSFFKGMTHEEIARHSGLPLGTVKSNIRRALAALHLHLERR